MELKPCPFCGGEPVIGVYGDYFKISCLEWLCPCNPVLPDTPGSFFKSKAEAIEAWNRRVGEEVTT